MKVYLVVRDDQDSYADILGCYSSKEKALASFPYHESRLIEEEIIELELDPPNGEIYNSYWSAVVSSEGVSYIDGGRRMQPSKFAETPPFLFWDNHNDRGSAQAFGVTEEDAKAKATEALKLLAPVWQVGRGRGGDRMIEIKHPTREHVHKWENLEHKPFYAVHEDLDTARRMVLEHEASLNPENPHTT